jgi:predicted DNA binding CopG/RHH family protein
MEFQFNQKKIMTKQSAKERKEALDQEEQDLLDSLEKMDQSAFTEPSPVRQTMLRQAAHEYIRKETKMNIRIDPHELELIKEQAAREGLKYQSFVKSVLHRYITGQLVDKRSIIGK